VPKNPSKLEASAQRFYTVTDRFQGQLRVLEEAASPVHVQVTATEGDIEALSFLVLMEAARSAQEDLKAIMEGVKAINKEKAGWRRPDTGKQPSGFDFEAIFQLMATLYAKQLDAELQAIRDDLDGIGELSEMESLRLQMAMDRLSKMMSTLSNLLKKCADTSSQIVQNIK
jgi:hypothetical protein